MLAQRADSFTEGKEVAITFLRLAERGFGGIKLDVHDHDVNEAVNRIFAGGAEILLFHHGAVENLGNLRIG